MLKFRLTGPLVLMALSATMAWAQLKPKVPIVTCPRVSVGPTLDGRVDDDEWAAAGRLSDFLLLDPLDGPTGMPTLSTRVYVMHTTYALYLGAFMADDLPSELVANVTARDGKVDEDDSLQLFIDADGSREEYAHLVVNSRGVKLDQYGHDVAENFDWNAVAAVGETGWSVEIELPFQEGIPPLEGETWNLAVCRNAVGAEELSTWCRHERSLHEPQAFGEMVFMGPSLTAHIEDLGDRALGDNLALVTIHNLGPTLATPKLYVVVMGSDRRSHYFGTSKQRVSAGGMEQVHIPYKVRRCGPAWVALSLGDGTGTIAWRTAAFPIELPEVSSILDEILHEMAAAWQAWLGMADGDEKDACERDLKELEAQWHDLQTEVSSASGVSLARLSEIADEAGQVKLGAQEKREQVETAPRAERAAVEVMTGTEPPVDETPAPTIPAEPAEETAGPVDPPAEPPPGTRRLAARAGRTPDVAPGATEAVPTGSEPTGAASERGVFGGEPLPDEARPELRDGIPTVSLKHIFQAAGGTLFWSPEDKRARAVRPGTELIVQVGSSQAVLNGEERDLEAPAIIDAGRILVPFGIVAEALGLSPDAGPPMRDAARPAEPLQALTPEQAAQFAGAQVVLDGKVLPDEARPELNDGTLMISLKHTFEAVRGVLVWSPQEKRAHAASPLADLHVQMGSTDARLNGLALILPAPALVKDGRILVPFELVARALASSFEFDERTGQVVLTP